MVFRAKDGEKIGVSQTVVQEVHVGQLSKLI